MVSREELASRLNIKTRTLFNWVKPPRKGKPKHEPTLLAFDRLNELLGYLTDRPDIERLLNLIQQFEQPRTYDVQTKEYQQKVLNLLSPYVKHYLEPAYIDDLPDEVAKLPSATARRLTKKLLLVIRESISLSLGKRPTMHADETPYYRTMRAFKSAGIDVVPHKSVDFAAALDELDLLVGLALHDVLGNPTVGILVQSWDEVRNEIDGLRKYR